MKKLVIAIVFVLCFMCGSVALADGILPYDSEMYTVVVSNPNGAKCYYWDGELKGIYAYGEILSVTKSETDGILELALDYSQISSSDVEIYGEPVTPQDLRFRKLWYK